jgi:hypothetical protein
MGAHLNDAEQTPRDVGRVCPRDCLAGDVDVERCLPQTGDQSVPQKWGIAAGCLLQGCDLTGRVGQDDAEGDLTGIREVRHSERMPDLEMKVLPAFSGALPRLANAVEVAVEPVHRGPADAQSAAAVDPRSPLAGAGRACLGAGDIACQILERIDVQWGSVVQAVVEVRLRPVLPTTPATTEQYPHHAVNLNQPLPQLPQRLVIDHPHIMADQRALSRCRGSQ